MPIESVEVRLARIRSRSLLLEERVIGVVDGRRREWYVAGGSGSDGRIDDGGRGRTR
jgi:hypothetical protein